ncbi:response regulator transcription factor, partial [Micromonospora sp. NPDC047753]|uniref:response regulator n=1 Tax=Micromonospora sp. NPDC047753 TaxID=3154817 RepID=UPI00340EB219
MDDHPLFVRGLELLLPITTNGRVEVAASTGDAAAAAALVSSCRPDLALVDLHMPPPGGIRAVAAIRRTTPRVRVVAMSGSADPGPAVEALRAGAEGFLPKTSEPAPHVAQAADHHRAPALRRRRHSRHPPRQCAGG